MLSYPIIEREDRTMRQFARPSRQYDMSISQLDSRTLRYATMAIIAIGLAACSADQSLPLAPQHAGLASAKVASPSLVYVSDASGVDQLWTTVNGVASRFTFSDAADRTPHSAAGHLVFASYRSGDEEIYMAKNDLSGLKRLTAVNGQDEQAKLSPNAARIAFVSTRSGTARLWTMDSTGAEQLALNTASTSNVPEAAPAWSPNGAQIAFTSTRTGMSQVFVVAAAGGTPVQLSHEMNGAFDPAWSADGTQIYFVSVVGSPSIRSVTLSTGATSDWVSNAAGIGQPACASSGCFAVTGAYGANGDIVMIGHHGAISTVVSTAANENSPTVLVP